MNKTEVVPERLLSTRDAVALVVGIVIGAGIFKFPALVAGMAGSETMVYVLWLAGGLVSIVGALCYAELATAFPNAGGDYHFLTRAFGRHFSFLFAWARATVITTGSIALLAFVLGDYASNLVPLGEHSSAIWAALVVVALTIVNWFGIREGKATQNVLTVFEVGGLVAIVVAGLFVAEAAPPSATAVSAGPGMPAASAMGLAMVFVLLTYGGWNEAAYMSAEVKDRRRGILRALVIGLLLVTALYLLVNFAYLRGLGLEGVSGSKVVAADLLARAWGPGSATLMSLMVIVASLTSINATMLVGARSNYALGHDWKLFAWLGGWHASGVPRAALLVQSAISLVLVGFGAATRKGFETMVDFTAPVFWFFFLMTGIALMVLRRTESAAERPFRVPFYPLLPLLFCASAGWLLYSSLAYTGVGALAGVGVLLAGGVVLAWSVQHEKTGT
ncbi:MAG: amino acid permease [Betaproteobacteria bacterium]